MKLKGSPLCSPRSVPMWIGVLYCFAFAFAGCSNSTPEQKKRQSLPDFYFEGWNDESIERSKLPEDAPVTIFYFDPDCSHCKETMNAILGKLDQFGNNTLVILSSADRTQVMVYMIEHDLLNRPGVMVGLCEPQEFLDTFGTTQTPTVLFYGADWDLKRAFKGAMQPANVLEGLKAAQEE